MPIHIVLVDDHAIVRDGLRSLLDGHNDFLVVGEAADGHTAVQTVCTAHPDLVIIDIGLPGLNGIEATRQMIAQSPDLLVIALSMHADLDFVVEMLNAGAHAYLVKDSAFDELQQAIRAVLQGQYYISAQLNSLVIAAFCHQHQRQSISAYTMLTCREREVLQLLAEGYSNKEVAARLGLTVRSAETYRAQVMDKLNLHSVAALTKYAVRTGLTSLD